MTKTRVCDQHVVKNVGRVTDVGHCQRTERGERLVLARTRDLRRIEEVSVFMQGENICKGLSGMPEGRKCVEHGNGRIFCKFLQRCLYECNDASR